MCRLAAYLGPELLLKDLFHEGPHSLYEQSWNSKEMKETSLNADGYGFGWHLDNSEAANFTSTLPIWADTNLDSLGSSLRQPLWLAYVRSATPGQTVNQANTQPFKHGNLLFLHNGRIDRFNEGPRAALHSYLPANIASQIEGNTDSEYLFALLKQALASGLSMDIALSEVCASMADILDGNAAMLNMVVSDGQTFTACRQALNGARYPSLYISDAHAHFPEAVLLASERFSNDEQWQTVEEGTLVVVDKDRNISQRSL